MHQFEQEQSVCLQRRGIEIKHGEEMYNSIDVICAYMHLSLFQQHAVS